MQSVYHALSVDKWDAADLTPGPHQGTPASATTDGHGRTVTVTELKRQGVSFPGDAPSAVEFRVVAAA